LISSSQLATLAASSLTAQLQDAALALLLAGDNECMRIYWEAVGSSPSGTVHSLCPIDRQRLSNAARSCRPPGGFQVDGGSSLRKMMQDTSPFKHRGSFSNVRKVHSHLNGSDQHSSVFLGLHSAVAGIVDVSSHSGALSASSACDLKITF